MALYAAVIVPGLETKWGIAAACAAAVVAVGMLVWMVSLRLTLTAQGLSYRSIADSREIAWTDVEKSHWRARDWVWIHFVPASPPDRHVVLVMKDGSRLRLGDSFAEPLRLIGEVIAFTRPHLYRRMLDELNRGGTIDLGAVRISRMSGVEFRTLLGFDAIGFDEIERYGIDDDGNFRIWRRADRGSRGVAAERVANVNALVGVIDAVFHGDRSKPATVATIDRPPIVA